MAEKFMEGVALPKPRKHEVLGLQKKLVMRLAMQQSFLRFCMYFFKVVEGSNMLVNWHHLWFASIIQDIYDGKLSNVIVNVSPGSTKSLAFSSMFVAWAFARNPHCRFLGVSFSEDRVEKNSMLIKAVMESKEYQDLFPGMSFKKDANKKAVWTVEYHGKSVGEYTGATMFGQITSNRAGYMDSGFTGAIIVDDPLKPEDAWSDSRRKMCNRVFSGTVRSRKAHPGVPTVLVMQRLHVDDATGHLLAGGTGDKWTHVVIPARFDAGYLEGLHPNVRETAMKYLGEQFDDKHVISYWPYKEPLSELAKLEEADPYTFKAQYLQDPASLSGDTMFPLEWWVQEDKMPAPDKYEYVRIIADTASKVKEINDDSVLWCYGMLNGDCYVINIEHGKWDANELLERAEGFYHAAHDMFGDRLREFFIEDKSSGTSVLQILGNNTRIPLVPVKRGGTNDTKLERARAAQTYVRSGRVHIPSTARWKMPLLLQAAEFSALMTHKHDDMVDCLSMMVEQEYVAPKECVITPLVLW